MRNAARREKKNGGVAREMRICPARSAYFGGAMAEDSRPETVKKAKNILSGRLFAPLECQRYKYRHDEHILSSRKEAYR